MSRQIVILNDTSTRYHHGCSRVMRLLTEGLHARGARILGRAPARHAWEKDATLLAAMKRADTIVINGEGTLHHGRPQGERLLRVAQHSVADGKRLVLLNALYDENPDGWGIYLKRFDLLSARDSRSASALSRAAGREVSWVPDLSLSSEVGHSGARRSGCLLGDAVRLDTRRAMARATKGWPDMAFLPTKTRPGRFWRAPVLGPALKSGLWGLYTGTSPVGRPPFHLARDEMAYLDRLSGASIHITGRFHGVCLSLLTETPYLAVDSVSGKIGRLLDDLGLGRDRLLSHKALQSIPRDHEALALTDLEKSRIRSSLAQARDRASRLLDEVCA